MVGDGTVLPPRKVQAVLTHDVSRPKRHPSLIFHRAMDNNVVGGDISLVERTVDGHVYPWELRFYRLDQKYFRSEPRVTWEFDDA